MNQNKGITRESFEFFNPLPGEAGLCGTIYVFGTPYHFHFVEVKEKVEGQEWEAVDDPFDRLEDVQRLYDSALLPTKIDGKLYIGFAHPHGD